MKHLTILLATQIGLTAFGQMSSSTVETTIFLADTQSISVARNGTTLSVTSSNPAIATILQRYTIYDVTKSYSSSRFPYMRHYYTFKTDREGLYTELNAYNAQMFPSGDVLKPQLLLEPNEFYGWA